MGSATQWTDETWIPRFPLEIRTAADHLRLPLRWQEPKRVSLGIDLFHEDVPAGFSARVFDVMATAKRHIFQVLTKRPDRMRAWLTEEVPRCTRCRGVPEVDWTHSAYRCFCGETPRIDRGPRTFGQDQLTTREQPLPNVWLGVPVEDQPTADERTAILLDTPAAVRWVSFEPALAGVDFDRYLTPYAATAEDVAEIQAAMPEGVSWALSDVPALDWLVVGGESGPNARPCDLEWIRSAVEQCQAAGVPVFVKQLGAKPIESAQVGSLVVWRPELLKDKKGGDPDEWPEDLRVREFPEAVTA